MALRVTVFPSGTSAPLKVACLRSQEERIVPVTVAFHIDDYQCQQSVAGLNCNIQAALSFNVLFTHRKPVSYVEFSPFEIEVEVVLMTSANLDHMKPQAPRRFSQLVEIP
jgi:hypothetical protein